MFDHPCMLLTVCILANPSSSTAYDKSYSVIVKFFLFFADNIFVIQSLRDYTKLPSAVIGLMIAT